MTNNHTQTPSPVTNVVALGASAGGLEALQEFFSWMPENSGLSIVIIQHLSPDYKSLMAEILGKHTNMQVLQVRDQMPLEPNTVYLIPPKKNMTIQNGALHLADQVNGVINHPIDIFFTSLAESCKEHAIAVVLSGTGTDGTSGLKTIKEYGGIAIVQDPASAKFDGMPRSAISTRLADFVLAPRHIAEEILNLVNYPRISISASTSSPSSEEDLLSTIYTILQRSCGVDFTHYKRNTILRRIERRMAVTHSPTLSEFAKLISENPSEANLLVKDILIGVTRFFRDAEFFEKLKNCAIYNIIRYSEDKAQIRIWSAGCSTGEEAYSLAILFQEVLEETQTNRDIKIFATDVDSQAIEQASKGIFPESIADDVSPARLAKYFVKKNDQYLISKSVRKMIIFAPHNMLSDPPFGKLDLISCRNVLIYFQPILQKTIFSIFNSALKQGGYLFLGKSETASEYAKFFNPVALTEKIYVHRGVAKMDELAPPIFNLPNIQTVPTSIASSSRREDRSRGLENVYIQFIERFLPASVVIDSQNDIVHLFGNCSDYLNIAPGKASFNFFNMVNKDIRLIASTAINRCRTENISVTYTDIVVDYPSGRKVINLSVHPIPDNQSNFSGLLAVLFLDRETAVSTEVTEKYEINATAAQRIADLEHDLRNSKKELRTTIAELETVNEELQAANEELLTANEELQSSNEELQSVNEELYTVNSEFQQKLDELTMLADDLSNFLSSTMIGILFIDSKLNIRKFTEYIGREFQIVPQDIGRSLKIFAHSFPEEDIISDAEEVLKKLAPIDREVIGMNGRFYTMRIAPYRTTENNIRGIVITVIDSLRKNYENRQGA